MEIKLGEIVPEDQADNTPDRDAVHVAVKLMKASTFLRPGERVGLDRLKDGYASPESEDAEAVGIVDPFLAAQVRPEERFWCFLFPGSVTGMGHRWKHPAFGASDAANAAAGGDKRAEIFNTIADRAGVGVDALLKGAVNFCRLDTDHDDKYLGVDLSSGDKEVTAEEWQEFWKAFEKYTGLKPDKHYRNSGFFVCRC